MDLVQIVAELAEKGVGFESLTENIETRNASCKLMFNLFAALALKQFVRAVAWESGSPT